MICVSTRNPNREVSFRDAIFEGLAPDGGLYVPKDPPHLRDLILSFSPATSFVEIAAQTTFALLEGELTEAQCRTLAQEAFPFSPSLRTLEPAHLLLELFHGPSCAFKDFGASFLAGAMKAFLNQEKRRAIILTATSGDTGSAVAQAFHGKEGIDVVILYPSGRVSPSQELQLTTVGGNVHALEVQGSFDDCQRLVKDAFQDPFLNSHYPLTSANSINLGRLLPQSFYYLWAFAQIKNQVTDDVYFCVPSGNFGNLTAGIMAWTWGLPVEGFIGATNRNDGVPQYLETGTFRAKPSVATPANAMDVGNPSNLERLQHIFDGDVNRMRTLIHGWSQDDASLLSTMAQVYRDKSLFLCPHTAVGVRSAQEFALANTTRGDMILTLGTADPGKFEEVVVQATGKKPPIPARLGEFMTRKKQSTLVQPELGELKRFLERLT
ncbi:MAG: threonine synthase [Spirochaetales bacterium]|nr:threonine synthase [Spirochaetales bacterium]